MFSGPSLRPILMFSGPSSLLIWHCWLTPLPAHGPLLADLVPVRVPYEVAELVPVLLWQQSS
jgi:hypothetical protein